MAPEIEKAVGLLSDKIADRSAQILRGAAGGETLEEKGAMYVAATKHLADLTALRQELIDAGKSREQKEDQDGE